jgi:hypothetical protein
MKRLLPIICVLLAFHAVHGDDTKTKDEAAKVAKAVRAAKAQPTPTVEVKGTADNAATPAPTPYVPKNKSEFTSTTDDHNPFWPIGWVKTEALATSEGAAPYVPHPTDFTVTTIMLNEPPMAVINGKDMAEGEIATLNANGQQVTVQLMAVQDGRVVLRWQNQDITVLIHRDEAMSAADTQAPTLGLK